MITRDNLPKSYKPYEILVVCSNTIKGGGHILAIGEVIPLLIGRGDKPQIWLQALSNNEKREFVTIVEASISRHKVVKIYEENETLNVQIGDTQILSVKTINENSAEISLLDLRPLGINLFGNKTELKVGNSTFSGNSFFGVGTMIGFGK